MSERRGRRRAVPESGIGRWRAQAVASATVAACVACGAAPEGPRPNFVLVVVDTLRADHLHYAGMDALSTPSFDALKQQSTWFRKAYAAASWTLPSLASLFVSQLGSQHRAVRWGAQLAPELLTLPELLRAAGYRTGGFSANVLIDDASGVPQGFDSYRVVYAPVIFGGQVPDAFPNAPGKVVTEQALAWLREVAAAEPAAPFFAYLHYMEPHTPYRCLHGDACRLGAAVLNARLLAQEWDFTPAEVDMLRGLYGAEVEAMDRELGNLIAALRADGLWENTWLVVTADHGEQLGERGRYLHGDSLDPHELHVPLLVSGPERRAASVDTPVSLIDLAPTLAELARLEGPASFRGRSLVPALSGGELAPVPVVAELFQRFEKPPRDKLAVVSGKDFFVMGMGGELHRFDPERDPLGRRARRATRQELSRALGEIEAAIDFSREPLESPPPLSAETRKALSDLGYAP